MKPGTKATARVVWRSAYTAAAALSALVFVAGAPAWGRSYWAREQLHLLPSRQARLDVVVSSGMVQVEWQRHHGNTSFGAPPWYGRSSRPYANRIELTSYRGPGMTDLRLGPVAFQSGALFGTFRRVVAPCWLVTSAPRCCRRAGCRRGGAGSGSGTAVAGCVSGAGTTCG